MKNLLKLILCILIPLAIGAISGIATTSKIGTWYKMLNKPFFNPPNYIFGPVWSLLYILMGVSFYLILQSTNNEKRSLAISIFVFQLILNFLWSFLFFKYQLLGAAFIEILLLWGSIVYMIIVFYRINKTAGIIQIPYLLWVSFASILSGSILWLN